MNAGSRMLKLALLAGASMGCASAWAIPPGSETVVTRSESVQYRKAQASTIEGAEKLYLTLKAAAARVCEAESPLAERAMGGPDARISCVKEALDQAVQDVGIPMVSVVHVAGSRVARTMASR